MAYTGKTNWVNNEIVEAADMNRIEQGISEHTSEIASIDNVHGLRGNNVELGAGSYAGKDFELSSSIAIGNKADSSVDGTDTVISRAIAIGYKARASDGYELGGAIALGYQSIAEETVSVALGANAEATAEYAVSLGRRTVTENANTGTLGGSGAQITNKWIVPGTFTVNGTKNFEIPHPKPEKKATHRIRHGAVESPTAGDTLYRFKVQSTKENDLQYIDLPDYFIHLNKDVQIFVTGQGHFGNGYGELNEETERLEITCQNEGEYNVLVIGSRNDDHQSVKDWDIKGVEREIGESWTGETYAFSVDEIIEVEEIKEEVA